MGLFPLLSLTRRRQRAVLLVQVVDQLVEASQKAVWQRVEGRIEQMSPAESRGYIRARAARTVWRHTDALLLVHPSLAPFRRQIIHRVTDNVVRRLQVHRVRQASPVRQAA